MGSIDKAAIGRQMAFIAVAGVDASYQFYTDFYAITTKHTLAQMIKATQHIHDNYQDKYIGHANKYVVSSLLHGLKVLRDM